MTKIFLFSLFSCGKVKSMKAIIDKQTNRCKGFGFIDFETTEDAKTAIAQLQKKGYVAQLAKVKCQQIKSIIDSYIFFFQVISTTRTRYN